MNNKPSHKVFATREYEDKDGEAKTAWNEIGAAFVNAKGGFNLQLSAVPVNGKCVLFPYEERESGDGTGKKNGSGSGPVKRS